MRLLTLCLLIFASGCTQNGMGFIPGDLGFAPVYLAEAAVKQVSSGTARQTAVSGKIYAYRNYIFQNDINTGIHIIDNSNPSQPKKIGFITIPLSTEVAVKGDFLYSNNYDDLVVFDISKPAEPKLLKRIEHVFPAVNQHYPPVNNTMFECADPEKGVVVRWERKPLTDPKCRR